MPNLLILILNDNTRKAKITQVLLIRSHISHDQHTILPVRNKDWNNCVVA